jgi:outer membrane biosynthesis protein TonB
MSIGLGPRFLIEAGFLIAVAVIAGVARLSTLTIVFVMAAAWFVVATVEWTVARMRPGSQSAGVPPLPEAPAGTSTSVWTEPQGRDDNPQPAPAQESPAAQQPEPQPAPEPDVTPTPVPEPEHEPDPAPEQPDSPAEPLPTQPRVAVAPPPPPVPEPVVVAPAPSDAQPQVVSIAARATAPREWNLWDLERLARNSAGGDVGRDEERSYILMYLRDFANADGILPADFDTVVRESFADVVDGVHS